VVPTRPPHRGPPVQTVPVEAKGRVAVQAEAEHVPGGGGQLRAHQDEHPVPVALDGLRVEVVVVGDPEEGEAGRLRRPDHLLGRATTVGERRVHVHDTRRPRVAVVRPLADERQGTPEGDAQQEGAEKGEGGEDGDP